MVKKRSKATPKRKAAKRGKAAKKAPKRKAVKKKPAGKSGRSRGGKFVKGHGGGPGRPPGSPNQTTVDLRILRKRMAASWDRVGGDKLFDKIAKADPIAYVRFIIALLPNDVEIEIPIGKNNIIRVGPPRS